MSKAIEHFNIKELDKYFERDTSKAVSLFLCNYKHMYSLETIAKLIYGGVFSSNEMVDKLIQGESISGFHYDYAIFMSNVEVLYLASKFSIDLTKDSQYTGFTIYETPDWDKIIDNVNRIVNYILTDYIIPENFGFKDEFERQINALRQL